MRKDSKSNIDKFITSFEASQMLDISPDYVRKLIYARKLKACKMGRNWVVKIIDVNRLKGSIKKWKL